MPVVRLQYQEAEIHYLTCTKALKFIYILYRAKGRIMYGMDSTLKLGPDLIHSMMKYSILIDLCRNSFLSGYFLKVFYFQNSSISLIKPIFHATPKKKCNRYLTGIIMYILYLL